MPFSTRDLDAYRRDERLGHKMMTPEERIQLLKVRSVSTGCKSWMSARKAHR